MPEVISVLSMLQVPKSVNAHGGGAGTHHMAAHKEKKAWEGLYLMELMAARVPKGMSFCVIDLTVRWPRKNGRDVENYRHPIVKPLLDALQKGGYLPNDTDEFVDVRGLEFVYPKPWPHARDPRIKGELVIRLEATYP